MLTSIYFYLFCIVKGIVAIFNLILCASYIYLQIYFWWEKKMSLCWSENLFEMLLNLNEIDFFLHCQIKFYLIVIVSNLFLYLTKTWLHASWILENMDENSDINFFFFLLQNQYNSKLQGRYIFMLVSLIITAKSVQLQFVGYVC